MQNDILFWVWLAERLGAKSRDFRWLILHYETAYELFHLEEAELDRIEEISERTRQRLAEKDLSSASEIVAECERQGIGILPFGSMEYPRQLRDLREPPIVLYYKGTLPQFHDRLSVAMVGTRKMSRYGLENAYRISFELTRSRALVVSGMATGIDGVSAAAALLAGGETVAVLGCGVDVVYPKHHATLYREIIKHGAVISEYAPGTRPNNYHFPARNRIISGLCQGTLVVEAGLKSGTLITAKDAIMQGRDVFAIPANVTSEGAQGTNGLLRDGANFVQETEDILRYYKSYEREIDFDAQAQARKESKADMQALAELGVIELIPKQERSAVTEQETDLVPTGARASGADRTAKPRTKKHAEEPNRATSSPNDPPRRANPAGETAERRDRPTSADRLGSLSPIQLAILQAIPDDRPITPDELARLEYPNGDISAALTMLEILGHIRKLPGALYTKV